MQYRVVAYAWFAALTGTVSTAPILGALSGSAGAAVPDGLTAQNRGQHDQALQEWIQRALGGDARSHFNIGLMYEGGSRTALA